ncbi:hypothetical protein Tco_0668303 [Tanacetum coccineum]
MEDDMVKARDQLINILYSLEQIYPLAFFNLMIHLVMHLPKEAIEGGHVPFRWMYPFKRYMKKLKNYVRNKAKLEGSIVEGYVADEALKFCSQYILGVETKFNRPDCNQDYPHSTSQFQVFRSLCRMIGKQSFIQLDSQEMKKVIWYILHNSPEIGTYLPRMRESLGTTTSHSCYDDNDFIDDEDDIPHDLANSDNEVLTNSDDIADEVTTNVYSSDEEY